MLKDFKPRLYQETILATCNEKSTLVVLPTGMGKTGISMLLAVQRLRNYPKSKILVLAPTKPLAEQHLNTFKKHIDSEDKFVLFTGFVKPEKRKELWKDAKFIFSTPQCVIGDTQIFVNEKGPIGIKDFVESLSLKKFRYGSKNGYYADIDEKVLGLKDGKIMPLKATMAYKLPTDELFEIRTEMAGIIKCTPEHPLISIDSSGNMKWVEAQKLKDGDFVGMAREVSIPENRLNLYNFFENEQLRVVDRNLINSALQKFKEKFYKKIKMSDYSRFRHNSIPLNKFLHICKLCSIKLPKNLLVTNKTGKSEPVKLPRNITPELAYILGAMIGDGHIGDRRPKHGMEVVFSELSYDDILKKFETAMLDVFGIKTKKDKDKGLICYSTALSIILNKLDIPSGNKTKSVRVPSFLFSESDETILGFISGLFNADGDAHKNMFRIATTSKDLANGLRWLLLRLGIISSINKRSVSSSYIQGRKIKGSEIFIVIVSGRKQLEKLIHSGSFSTVKSSRTIKQFTLTKNPYTRSKDVLPVKVGLHKAYLEHRKNNGAILDEVRIAYNSGYFSTTKLSELLPKLNSNKAMKLMEILKLPIRWVKVKSIKRIKWDGYVYDLTVENYHNFVSNLLLSHNTVENDIITNKINLEDVSLLVFDEAHRATGDYAYTFIAKQYHKLAKFSRILALTASPGSEVEKIEEVCKNLYIEDVEIRTDEDPDVKPYIQKLKIDFVKLELPENFKQIRTFLEESMKSKLKKLKKWGILKRTNLRYVNKKELIVLQAQLHARASSGEKDFVMWNAISLLAEVMKLHHALELLETQGMTPLHNYLEKLVKEAETTKVRAVKNLVKDLNFRSALIKTRALYEKGVEHPKLNELIKIVKKEVKKKNVKIIIFTQYRETALKIVSRLNEEDVKTEIFVGQLKKGETGLTQKKQKEILDKFKEGEFNCLVSTSVGEEGLDIPEVDLVVFYEPIPSAIRHIQRRGRTARQKEGRVVVLIAKNTRDEGYRWSAYHKERRMYKTLNNLKNKLSLKFDIKQPTLTKYVSEDKVKIFADIREKASGVIKELLELGAEIDLKTLKIGDYVLSQRVAVETKTVEDFVNSIIDARLLQQIKELKTNFERPLIIVEGTQDIYSVRKVHPNAIRGMLATIAVSYGIPILQTKNYKETASLLHIIAKREQEETIREFSLHGDKKPLTLKEQQEYIVSALPGVGAVLSKPLLKKFGSVKKVINAKEEKLKKVELIGDKKAKRIKDVVDTKYEE